MNQNTESSKAQADGERAVALSLQGLEKTFRSDLLRPNYTAVKGLTCDFPAGKCTALLGHNGAGKTTTLRIILGLVTPDKGRVLLDGSPIRTRDRCRIGYMPEVNKLPANLRCTEVLDFAARLTVPRDQRRNRVDEIIRESGLDGHRRKKIKSMSKGLARRVAWALANLHKPDVLILDEPTTGLDPLGQRYMNERIREQNEAGRTVVLCTHELEQVRKMADHYHVLNRGQLVYSTLDGAEGGDASASAPNRYFLHLSGVTAEDLETLRDEASLAPWVRVFQEKFLCGLEFDDYPAAAAWLSTCLERGLMVLRFADDPLSGDDPILRHFHEDSSS